MDQVSINDAKAVCQKVKAGAVIVLAFDGGEFGVTSYGKDRRTCGAFARVADDIFRLILDGDIDVPDDAYAELTTQPSGGEMEMTKPKWRKRVTCPGWWLFADSDTLGNSVLRVELFGEGETEWSGATAYYGPLPEMPATC